MQSFHMDYTVLPLLKNKQQTHIIIPTIALPNDPSQSIEPTQHPVMIYQVTHQATKRTILKNRHGTA